MEPEKTIYFSTDSNNAFLADVRKEIDVYFKLKKISKTANGWIHFKTLMFLFSCVFLYCILLNGWFPILPRLLIWTVFGMNQALIAVNVGHDALHGSYFDSPLANKILGFLAYDCLGLSSYIWKQTHNREHHTYTNIAGADPDIDKPGILRLSPHAPYYKIHRFQYLYVWILYAFVSLNWIFYADYTHLWKLRKNVPLRESILFFCFKILNICVMLVLPLLFSPMEPWIVLSGFMLLHCAAGLTVSIIFQLAHVVENVEFPLPDKDGAIPVAWGVHEMMTTSNFANANKLVTYLTGGLNFQIEHHLAPKISHCHYPQLSKIVRANAKKHKLPYHEYFTTRAAILSHAKFLKKLGSFSKFVS